MRKALYLFLILAAVSACGGQYGSSSDAQNFSIVIPEGWRKIHTARYFILTREGAFSQYILVQQRPINKPFRHSDGKLKKDMLPDQAAEVILNEMSSDSRVSDLQIIEQVPAKVGRYDGFKIVFTYRDQEGLKNKTVYYGFMQANWFYSLRYSAGETKYSNEDIQTFKGILDSFEIKKEGSAS